MVRKIFLLRHGDAVNPGYGITDRERPLSQKGGNQIRALGNQLKEENFSIDAAYCSTALRTRQTHLYLSESMQTNWEVEYKNDIYEASVRTLFDILSESESVHANILLVGHNPGITFLAEYLSGESIFNIETGQMLKLEFALGDWSHLSQSTCSIIN